LTRSTRPSPSPHRLSWAFGADELFFDRGSIRAGHQWPDALERALNAAKVLVLIVGEAWLTAF